MSILNLTDLREDNQAKEFCNAFINSNDRPKYIFGRNVYAESIASYVNVNGFIDDFTLDREYLGKPVYKTEYIPKNALVVSVVVLGRPLTAKKRLDEARIEHLDYFSFYRYSGLKLKPVTSWKDFAIDFEINRNKYEMIFNLLADEESKTTFTALINFRLSGNLSHMQGFMDRQDKQYFEDFLNLSPNDEVFVDVGGFDGCSTLEFIKHCPGYKSVHFFEPEESNMLIAKDKLRAFRSINYHDIALSDKKETVRFSINGSASSIDDTGEIIINTEKLDEVIQDAATYIKMDIEGAEAKALAGAKQTIIEYRPRLAICVYHKGDDMWKIPQQVLSYYEDYSMYLRHYTEGVTETVMFFIPK